MSVADAVSPAGFSTDLRYLSLVRLGSSLAGASDWLHVTAAVSSGLGGLDAGPPVRIWGQTTDGFQELARSPATHAFSAVEPRALREASESDEPRSPSPGDQRLLVGLHAGGVSLGVLEVDDPETDNVLLADIAPIVACSAGLLAAEGIGPLLSPPSVGASGDTAAVMAAFAAEAKRQLQHDRLSAYLLTADGRAFERFAVASSPIIAGEGVIIPFHEVGLRHVVATNRPLVSNDLGSDPRIVGREDRVIAGAGFRALLSVPLRMHGRPVGVLNFVSKTAGFYSDQDIATAEQIADQVAVFVENLRRQRRLRGLIRQEATDRERERLTREVYHAVAHAVPEINRIALELRTRLEGRDKRATEALQKIADLASVELADVRRAVIDAAPRALEAGRLGDVVEAALMRFEQDTGVTTKWTMSGNASGLPGGTTRAVYRVFQEALLNVRQHAAAKTLKVTLRATDELVLSVCDDGDGFEPSLQPEFDGLGLHGMRERVSALGGSLAIETAPGRGTTVTMTISGAFDRHVRHVAPPAASAPEDDWNGLVRVLVVHGDPLRAAGLHAILESTGDIRSLGDRPSLELALQDLDRLRPDVILLAANAIGPEPAEALAAARERSPSSRVVLLSRDGRPGPLVEAAIDGCIAECASLHEFPKTVRAVADGATVFVRPDADAEASPVAALTPRETEVLALVAAGYTNGEIGKTLFLATKTVERQVATIATKLSARNRAHAAALSVAHGLVAP